MTLQHHDIPRPHRRRATHSTVPGRDHGFVAPSMMRLVAASSNQPQRPDNTIVSNAIPLFFIGKSRDGFWIARDAEGRIGGIFLCRGSALRFARNSTAGCATMALSQRLELDIENKGNPLAGRIGAAKRVITRRAPKLTAFIVKTVATGRRLARRLSRSLAQERIHRAAVERELFRGQYRLASKNDDDLPVVR